jgi:hypothetical protein
MFNKYTLKLNTKQVDDSRFYLKGCFVKIKNTLKALIINNKIDVVKNKD